MMNWLSSDEDLISIRPKAPEDRRVTMTRAQQANEYDMGGHAAKAKELIGNAKEEVRMAAEAANAR